MLYLALDALKPVETLDEWKQGLDEYYGEAGGALDSANKTSTELGSKYKNLLLTAKCTWAAHFISINMSAPYHCWWTYDISSISQGIRLTRNFLETLPKQASISSNWIQNKEPKPNRCDCDVELHIVHFLYKILQDV